MAIPTLIAEKTTATNAASTHVVTIPDDTTDGVANDDILVVIAGADSQTGTPVGPVSPAYASGGWDVQINVDEGGDAEVFIFTCKVTTATSLPTSDTFTLDGNRNTRWWANAINGADYDNIEVASGGKTGSGNLDIDGITTTGDDNLVISCVSAKNATKNAAATIDSPGSWTVEDEGISDGGAGPDGGLSVLSITQASSGAIADETDLESGGGFDGWASATIAFPGVAGGTVVTPGVIATTATLPVVTPVGKAVVTPGAIATTATLPLVKLPQVVQGGTIATSAALPSPTIVAGVVLTPAAIATVSTLPTVTPVNTDGTTVTPGAIATTATLPVPTVVAKVVVTPASIATTAALPTVKLPQIVSGGTIATTAALPAPTVVAKVVITPPSIDTSASLPGPTLVTGVVVAPGAIATSATMPTVTIVIGAVPDVGGGFLLMGVGS